jgi:iron complex transport system ATP-binding protein
MLFKSADLLLEDASFSYAGGFALRHINLTVPGGQMAGLLGPNGSGKTTLLKLATGILVPADGDVKVGGLSLRQLSRKQIAQRIAVVPQQFNIPFAYTVEEVALLGRTPFVRGLAGEGKKDRQIAMEALEVTGMSGFRDRYFNDLSGGERQKIVLAMALAQEPALLLLDEPTAHLDICHQLEMLELLRKLNKEKQVTVVAAMHDLNLAALYCDRLVLIHEGRAIADGTPEAGMVEEILKKVYEADLIVSRNPLTGTPLVMLLGHRVARLSEQFQHLSGSKPPEGRL